MSCLFRAFSHFIPADSPDLIRQKVCNFLALNRSMAQTDASTWVVWQNDMNLTDYLKVMRTEQTWGGAVEIQAFCELYGVLVRVQDLRDSKNLMTFVPATCPYKRKIAITWNGNHYEPAR